MKFMRKSIKKSLSSFNFVEFEKLDSLKSLKTTFEEEESKVEPKTICNMVCCVESISNQ